MKAYVNKIFKDDKGNIWLGTYEGLRLLDIKNYTYITFRNSENDKHSITGNNIRSILQDSKGNIWIGTNGNGLLYYDRRTNKFINISG